MGAIATRGLRFSSGARAGSSSTVDCRSAAARTSLTFRSAPSNSSPLQAYEAAAGHKFALEASASGQDEVRLALQRMQEPVQEQLDEVARPLPPHVVAWGPYLGLYVTAFVALLAAILVITRRRARSHGYRMRETGAALLFASPWILGFAVLTGGPILFSRADNPISTPSDA